MNNCMCMSGQSIPILNAVVAMITRNLPTAAQNELTMSSFILAIEAGVYMTAGEDVHSRNVI